MEHGGRGIEREKEAKREGDLEMPYDVFVKGV